MTDQTPTPLRDDLVSLRAFATIRALQEKLADAEKLAAKQIRYAGEMFDECKRLQKEQRAQQQRIERLEGLIQGAIARREQALEDGFILSPLTWWPSDDWCQKARAALKGDSE